jgi:4-amino-4-deoxy-L-arabinose transferase-like glycosyltransferase
MLGSSNVVVIMFRRTTSSAIQTEDDRLQSRLLSYWADYGLFVIMWMFCLFVLFQNLGGPGLFEPDEGRNAEKAREILLLDDWVIPHENFLPVLDKPIFFFWLIAVSYKLFGLSEWASRLPSALAALGCLIVMYRFARRHWGEREALWSTLILVTSVEFFILARVVILDMTLNFFLTLALCSFYMATRTGDIASRRRRFLLMYGAMAVGSLIKGPVALVMPSMIIFFYLLVKREWSFWREMYIGRGALLVLLVLVPCYWWMEIRNPGYLRYFLWDENFGRFFLSSEFDRANPWYYFVGTLFVGLLPWSFLLPLAIKDHCRPIEDKNLFLILWIVLPLIFFSLSRAKLPHYILPIFAPLSILIAQSIVDRVTEPIVRRKWLLYTPWMVQIVVVIHLMLGSLWPPILPPHIRESVTAVTGSLWVIGLLVVFIYAAFFYARAGGYRTGHRSFVVAHLFGTVWFFIVITQMMVATSADRSAKSIIEKAEAWIDKSVQLVFFDTYLTGALFYLRADRPVWIVTNANKKNTVLGNYYVVEKRERPETAWGKAIYTFEEFRDIWRESGRPMVVIIKDKNIVRMKRRIGASPTELGRVDEYVLVTNQDGSRLRKDVARTSSNRSQ